ncbi:MAG TPA: ATPase [Microscillaceae bacterium]|nr:ATPase [Microscillaceae bacterium]
MSNLLEAFDLYGDFEKNLYYVHCFNITPSNLTLAVPLKASKENMQAVLELIDLQVFDLQMMFKSWRTEDTRDAALSGDYPYKHLAKSTTRKLVVWIQLYSNELNVIFLYDIADQEVEKWVLETNHAIRTKFGKKSGPVFKVLTREDNMFDTEDVKTESFKLDLAKMYNDDFLPINESILQALGTDRAGLILLHGTPGTGKTSYIKSLITRFEDKNFIFIQNEFINELLLPDFISFLLRHKNAILIIEDAEKVITSRDYVNANSVVSTILQLTDGLFSDYLNIKIICTFNTSIDKIDKALLRKGRMIAYYEFKRLVASKTDALMEQLGVNVHNQAMTLAEIFNHEDTGYEGVNERKRVGFGE